MINGWARNRTDPYTYRPDLCDRAALGQNFRDKFETLNRIHLTDSGFSQRLESIVTPSVFANPQHPGVE